jgi:hypothetical protein
MAGARAAVGREARAVSGSSADVLEVAAEEATAEACQDLFRNGLSRFFSSSAVQLAVAGFDLSDCRAVSATAIGIAPNASTTARSTIPSVRKSGRDIHTWRLGSKCRK